MFRQCRSRIGHISLARPASPVGRPCQCKRARHCQSYSMPNRSRGHDQLVPVRQQFAPLWSDRVVNELVILPSLARQPYPSTWNPGVSILNAYWRIFIWSGSSRACAFGNRRFALHPVQPGRVENRRNGGGRRVDVLAVLPRIVNGGNGHRVQVLYFSTCWVARWVAAMASFSTRFIRILAICASALSSKLLASTRSNYEGALDSAAAPWGGPPRPGEGRRAFLLDHTTKLARECCCRRCWYAAVRFVPAPTLARLEICNRAARTSGSATKAMAWPSTSTGALASEAVG
jgi:hypothetical protein